MNVQAQSFLPPDEKTSSRYQAIFQLAGDAMLVFSTDGHLLEANRRACRNLGLCEEALPAIHLHEIMPEFDASFARSWWASCENDGLHILTTHLKRTDSSSFLAELRVNAFNADGSDIILISFSDLTERRQKEQALLENMAFTESLLQTMTVPIFYKNKQGIYTGCNGSFAEFIGKRKDEIIGKTVFDIAPQPLSPIYRDKDLELLDAPVGVQVYESRVKHADGTIHDVVFHKSRIVDGNGEPVGIIGAILDITERKRYEAEQLNLIHQLEEKELAKTRFLASAGHDLRQPVSAANLFVQALKLTSPTPSQSELIEKLDESMETFSDLLEQLLNISKFDAGLIKPDISSFSLAQLFGWLENNFSQAAWNKQLQLSFRLPTDNPLILKTDIGLLKSVLMNLLANAIKFTSHGGILVSARMHQGRVLLQVWDTGMGISEKNLAHIFDEFYQINNPQRSRNKGLGLGLSIVRRSLTLLDSEIQCRSILGCGSVFSFTLPLDNSTARVSQQAATELMLEDMFDDSFTRGKRFVLVEDDALVAHAMISWLEGMGGKVQFFLNAEDALASKKISDADYFIADYMLGGKYNGIEFLGMLQQQLGKPVFAVLVTGDTSPSFVQAATKCDWPVLYKPVKPSRLIQSLRAQEEASSLRNR